MSKKVIAVVLAVLLLFAFFSDSFTVAIEELID